MAARLRVLLVTPDFPPALGGIQLLLHGLARHLAADVRVVTLHPSGRRSSDAGEPSADRNMQVRRVRAGRSGHRLDVARLNATAIAEAIRHRPDVVVSGHVVTAPAARLLSARLSVPYVQYVYAAEVSRRPRVARLAMAGAAAVLAVSEHSAALARGAGAPEGRVHVVHPGVDMKSASAKQSDTIPTLLTVARLADLYKGHDVILRAAPLVAARVPGVRWLVVGGGPLLDVYRSTAAATAADGVVRFTGAVSDTERDVLLGGAHVFALPSREGRSGGEGFGIVYLEASLHGLPAIAGDMGGARDAVVDGVTGLLVDATDHVAVAAAACRLLLDPPFARRLGAAGRERAETYTWTRMADQVLDVLTAAVATARRG
jgi:phosphatidylinositol alpha-1,6-mannosyltransferase